MIDRKRFRYTIGRAVYADRSCYYLTVWTPMGNLDSGDLTLEELRALVRERRASHDYRQELGTKR